MSDPVVTASTLETTGTRLVLAFDQVFTRTPSTLYRDSAGQWLLGEDHKPVSLGEACRWFASCSQFADVTDTDSLSELIEAAGQALK